MASQPSPNEVEKLRDEAARWKQLYEEQLRKNQILERRLRGEVVEEHKPTGSNSQRRTKSQFTQAKGIKEADPPSKVDSEKDRVKNKLRLACSQNDASLLREAISEAERLGMPEVEYARKKLATISSYG